MILFTERFTDSKIFGLALSTRTVPITYQNYILDIASSSAVPGNSVPLWVEMFFHPGVF
jgi:hypothetical protein